MNQLTGTAKKVDTFFRVIRIFLIIGAVSAIVSLLIIGAGFLFSLDPNTIGTGYDTLSLGMLELTIAEGFVADTDVTLIHVAVGMALVLVVLIIGVRTVDWIREILAPMKQGEPFAGIVSVNLRKLAIVVIALGVVENIATTVETLLITSRYDLYGLLNSDRITGVTVKYEYSLSFIAIAVLLFLLSYVFRYGEQLQRLSDETL